MTLIPAAGQPLSAAVRRVMQANRRRDTKPEVRLRSALHRAGYRFRVDLPVQAVDRRVRVDVAFPGRRVAVFVDGCFWHGCPEHGNVPRHNAQYWEAKLRRNVDRDSEVTRALESVGWRVVRIWEHETLDTATRAVVAALAR